jgi:glycosyltransferase involved in cell wall biosynthesis
MLGFSFEAQYMPSDSTRAKRIWIVNRFATPPDAPGGTRHYDFGIELAKQGYDVTIFAAALNYMLREVRRDESKPLLHHDGVKLVWVKSLRYRKNDWRRALGMLGFSLNVIAAGITQKRPNVVIGSSPHLFAALSAYILAKLRGSRFFLEIRDLWPQTLIDMRKQRTARENAGLRALSSAFYTIVIALLRMMESLLYRKAERIIVLSEGVGRYIANRGISHEKISLLPNGVYLEQFEISEDRERIRARLGLTDQFVVMYAGAHGPANALETILDAGRWILNAGLKDQTWRNVVLVLIGDGPSRGELLQMVDTRALSNVRMLPAVPKNSIPDLLNAADALVITLRSVDLFSYGISPNKLFEYMASGKPILCAVNGDVAGLVTRAEAGIAIEPEDPEALAQAIASLMKDRTACLDYGANGRSFVEQNFSRSRIAKELASII